MPAQKKARDVMPALALLCCADSRRLLADRVSRVVQLLVQHALFVAGEAATVLRGHVVRFLADDIEPMVQGGALWRRVIALIHAFVDPAGEIVDPAVDLMKTLIRDLLRTGARCRRGLGRDHAGGDGTEQGAGGNGADETRHGLSRSRCRWRRYSGATDDRGCALTGEGDRVVTLYSFRDVRFLPARRLGRQVVVGAQVVAPRRSATQRISESANQRISESANQRISECARTATGRLLPNCARQAR
ncbi:hypothetical protein BN2475_340157 [Paraburkholderia ribeironis]|uniref:Uncharacterized protein n=1 Tax=Paraburkholderia ribeironis TaxID=1247936 RepID=A0A1N7S4C1_9BURK|nr:hypothetical protein BN2475_340157 [Paraburkholderia ribeironis]